MNALPFRLKMLRKKNRLSLDALSQMTGVTKSYLSKLERGLSQPSISIILRLASAYGLSVADLVDERINEPDDITIVRKSERRFIRIPGEEGDGLGEIRYQILGSSSNEWALAPFIALPPMEFPQEDAIMPHEGEEFIFIVRGVVEIKIGDRIFRLNSGDSIHFNSEYPHRFRSVGKKPAEALVVTLRA
ncbi:helix-turn-helix domain-containing protein [Castellaniella sp. S9]|uniref:helix-turn-helix domain-containing protein n=1 Tax=Castellaniella sp. S9 TaxID=2993652 RepID=UPI0022B397D9|nr:XRE family transcriptional regulator [Castellaniella sp. S9]